ncbi:MAG: class I SAM-dependent methyltransferase [Candidatus Dojkabacteria bacterium]
MSNSPDTDTSRSIEVLSVGKGGRDDPLRVELLPVLHRINNKEITNFQQALRISPSGNSAESTRPLTITDIGTGTGFAARQAVEAAVRAGRPLHLNLLDLNATMLQKAEANVVPKDTEMPYDFLTIGTHLADLSQMGAIENTTGIQPDSQDIILMKMVRHEVPAIRQASLLAEVRNILKPGGRLILWDVLVPETSEGAQAIQYSSMIKAKDILLGKTGMAQDREFTTLRILKQILNRAGFNPLQDVQIQYQWDRTWDTIHRWVFEFGNHDLSLLSELNNAVSMYVPEWLRRNVEFQGNMDTFMRENLPQQFMGQIAHFGIDMDERYVVQGHRFAIPNAIITVTKN